MQMTQDSKKECEISSETPYNSFRCFFFEVFALGIKRVEGIFLPAEHVYLWATIFQAYERTSIVSARKHLKTTSSLAYLAWKLYRMEKPYNEWLYLAYKTELAQYQLKRLKRYINALQEEEHFGSFVSLTDAESILHYTKDGKEFIVEPEGITSFKRGRAPDGIIADDILKDPESNLDLTQIDKLTRIYFEEVESMPKEELHLRGTPQDDTDLFSKVEASSSYYCKRFPAIADHAKQLVLWKDRFPWEKLQQIRDNIGEKAFNKEYLCRPVRGEEAYIKAQVLERITLNRLKNYGLQQSSLLKKGYVVGGFDIGKKTHPSHLTVFSERHKRLFQIHSKFMDSWDYKDQIGYLKEAIRKFHIQKLFYDNTRAEFEECSERGDLPGEMEGISFTSKSKFTMATELDQMVTTNAIFLLPDERQRRQILSVDCDLNAPETSEGHGDSFYSLCLAVSAYKDGAGINVWELA